MNDFNKLKEDLEHKLSLLNRARTVVLGVGNRLRGDDGVGSVIAGRLASISGVNVFDTETVPENYIGKALSTGCDNILFIDAMDFGEAPGYFNLQEISTIYDGYLSTHGSSLTLIIDMLGAEKPVKGYILGIQPEDTSLNEGLSDAVHEAADVIIGELVKWLDE
jgi:hydrogenase 3 maturation protease